MQAKRSDMNNLTSNTISWLRFVLVMMVLLVHVHPDANPNYLGMDNLSGGTAAQIVYTIGVSALFVICNLSVPLFFFISGYLFFTNACEWDWRNVWIAKMRRRVHTLLIPYLVYNLLSAINGYVMQVLNPLFTVSWDNPSALPFWGEFWYSTTACVGMTNILGFSIQLYYPADIPLWFVRDLLLMVAVSPAIYWLVYRYAFLWLGLIALLFVCGAGATFPGFSTQSLLFFSFGACFRIRGIELLPFVHRWKIFGLWAGGVLLVLSTVCYACPFAQQLHHLFYIVGIFIFVFMGAFLLEKGWGKVHPLLMRSSFLIFAVHMVPVENGSLLSLSGVVSHWLLPMDNVVVAPIGYVLAASFIAVTGVLLYRLLEKYAPWLLNVLSGGR